MIFLYFIFISCTLVAAWLSGNALVLINVVALLRTWLVLGWVTIRGYTILVFNQSHPGLLSLAIPPWVDIRVLLIIIIWQFIRRRNMSVKSLQGRRTENTLLVLSYTMYDCRNRWVLRRFLKVDNVDAVRMSDGRLFHSAGPGHRWEETASSA